MKWWKFFLIMLSIGLVELTEAPIRKIWERVGPAGEEEKLARCVWVSNIFGSEQMGLDWIKATSDAYASAVGKNCSEARECSKRMSYWVHKVSGNGEGGYVSHKEVQKWAESDFCQSVVRDYKAMQVVAPGEGQKNVSTPEKQVQPTTVPNEDLNTRTVEKTISERWNQIEGGRNGYLASCIKEATQNGNGSVSVVKASALCEGEAQDVDDCLKSSSKDLKICLQEKFRGD